MKQNKKLYHIAKQTPLWKKLVALFLIVAMPLLFLSYRTRPIQQFNTNNPSKLEKSPSAIKN